MTLLEEVKNYLDITWDDIQTEQKLEGIIARGKRYINRIAGSEQDYDIDDKPKELLLDYCRYARSNALEMFQKNFLHELNGFQIDKEAELFETTDDDTNV